MSESTSVGAPLDFSRRADLDEVPELMDGPCSYDELRACLHDLSRVNTITFAYRPVMDFVARAFQSEAGRAASNERALRIVDVGSGYGDTLRKIEQWAARQRIRVALLGVDLNSNAVRAAREAAPNTSRVSFVAGDAFTTPEAQDADLIICSLVTHHLPEAEIVRLLRWMDETARLGWFICDLHRMPGPYRLFSALMRGPWWHQFIRPDGLASIRRSFRHEDWERICRAAGVWDVVRLRTYRPARLCVERLRQTRRPTQ